MLTKEDVDSWNKLFPDCPINKNNLSNPTEHFLTLALVCYLRSFGYNVEPPFSLNSENKENNKENRLFLIKLARQIDHFLKITEKSYAFTYYDLIRPTPKKTSHILYILLNYYYYFNLYKENVYDMANSRLRKLENAQQMLDDTRRDNERRREEALNMKSTIENLMEELPMARMDSKELHKKLKMQEEELTKIHHAHNELKEKLKHLEGQKSSLRKRLVPGEESAELCKQLKLLKKELNENKEMKQKIEEELMKTQCDIAKLERLAKDIERVREIIPIHLVEQLNKTNKQLEKTLKEENQEMSEQSVILKQIEEETEALKILEHQHQNQKQEFETKQKEQMKELLAKQKLLEQKNSQAMKLDEGDHHLECQIEEQKDIAEYLKENINEIMEAYEN